jgi:LysM repeat protein
MWALGRFPVYEAREMVVSARNNVKGLVQILGAVPPTPDPGDLVAALDSEPTDSPVDLPPSPTPTHTATPAAAEIIASEAISQTTPLIEGGAAPVTVTSTLEATSPAEEGEFYVVKGGDSLLGIGASLNVSAQDIAAANSISMNSVLKIGQRLRIPTPTATPEPTATTEPTTAPQSTDTATPTATASPTEAAASTPTSRPNANGATRTPAAAQSPPTATAVPRGSTTSYRIRSGDSLSSIAERFGIEWQDIARANGLKATTRLRIGQELIIPLAGLPPTMTPTPRPPATATTAPTPSAPKVNLPAPVLADPSNETPFTTGDGAMIVLTWQPVPGMPPGARYQVTVRWTENGEPQEWWGSTTANEIRLPPWLYARADQPARRYGWFVTVVQPTTDGLGGEVNRPLSPTSAVHTLTWN